MVRGGAVSSPLGQDRAVGFVEVDVWWRMCSPFDLE
jgi:hypothetical protein